VPTGSQSERSPCSFGIVRLSQRRASTHRGFLALLPRRFHVLRLARLHAAEEAHSLGHTSSAPYRRNPADDFGWTAPPAKVDAGACSSSPFSSLAISALPSTPGCTAKITPAAGILMLPAWTRKASAPSVTSFIYARLSLNRQNVPPHGLRPAVPLFLRRVVTCTASSRSALGAHTKPQHKEPKWGIMNAHRTAHPDLLGLMM